MTLLEKITNLCKSFAAFEQNKINWGGLTQIFFFFSQKIITTKYPKGFNFRKWVSVLLHINTLVLKNALHPLSQWCVSWIWRAVLACSSTQHQALAQGLPRRKYWAKGIFSTSGHLLTLCLSYLGISQQFHSWMFIVYFLSPFTRGSIQL